MSAGDELFSPERRRRAMEWAKTPDGVECLQAYSAAARKTPMTPERLQEREDETIRALIGLALVCVVWVALDALYRYLTTGG